MRILLVLVLTTGCGSGGPGTADLGGEPAPASQSGAGNVK